MAITVGILVFDGVDELDFVGPLDVFGAASWGRDDTRVVTIGSRLTPFRGVNGLSFTAAHDFTDAPRLDVLVVPGGLGTDALGQDETVLDWLRTASADARWLCSVCTGAFVLRAAGLAEGRRITTHSGAIGMLRSIHSGEVVEGQRFVVDGRLVTAAGVSAGIDMALWVVARLYGEDHAGTVRGLIEYAPAAPGAA